MAAARQLKSSAFRRLVVLPPAEKLVGDGPIPTNRHQCLSAFSGPATAATAEFEQFAPLWRVTSAFRRLVGLPPREPLVARVHNCTSPVPFGV